MWRLPKYDFVFREIRPHALTAALRPMQSTLTFKSRDTLKCFNVERPKAFHNLIRRKNTCLIMLISTDFQLVIGSPIPPKNRCFQKSFWTIKKYRENVKFVVYPAFLVA